MSIAAACPHCAHRNTVPDRFAGQRGRCSQCGEIFDIVASSIPPEPTQVVSSKPVEKPATVHQVEPSTTTANQFHQRRARSSTNVLVYTLFACGIVLGVMVLAFVAFAVTPEDEPIVSSQPVPIAKTTPVKNAPDKPDVPTNKVEPIERQNWVSTPSKSKPKPSAPIKPDPMNSPVDEEARQEELAKRQLANSIGAAPKEGGAKKDDEPYRLKDPPRRAAAVRPIDPVRPAVEERFGGLPDPACDICRGRGIVPLDPPTQFVLYDKLGKRDPKALTGCRYCPKCQADKDQAILNREAIAKLPIIDERHEYWKEKTNSQIIRAQTPRITVYSQLSSTETRRVAQAIAKASAHLELITKSLELTENQPDDCELVILSTKNDYLGVIQKFEDGGEFGGRDWTLARQLSGFTQNSNLSVSFKGSVPAPQHAVNSAGMLFINRATNHGGGDWLRVGFASYLEYAIFKMNAVRWADYELTEFNSDNNWRVALRQLVTQRRIRPWDEMFSMQLRNYGAAEHISAFGMVRFLIEEDRTAFLDFIKATGQRTDPTTALEAAYKVDLATLENRWTNWIVRGR